MASFYDETPDPLSVCGKFFGGPTRPPADRKSNGPPMFIRRPAFEKDDPYAQASTFGEISDFPVISAGGVTPNNPRIVGAMSARIPSWRTTESASAPT